MNNIKINYIIVAILSLAIMVFSYIVWSWPNCFVEPCADAMIPFLIFNIFPLSIIVLCLFWILTKLRLLMLSMFNLFPVLFAYLLSTKPLELDYFYSNAYLTLSLGLALIAIIASYGIKTNKKYLFEINRIRSKNN